jgi:hypothetical protein
MKSFSTRGKRVRFNWHASPRIYEMIRAAAEKSGRSLSQEAEFRLELSFRDEPVGLCKIDMGVLPAHTFDWSGHDEVLRRALEKTLAKNGAP